MRLLLFYIKTGTLPHHGFTGITDFVSESLDEVETSSAERCWMQHSLKQILALQKNLVATVQRLDAVETVPGRRKEMRLILAISCAKKTDIDYCLIREIETTTESLHDSQVDLSTKDEIVLRDRGYFGAEAKGIDFTMKRRTSEKPLEELDKERNRLISILRSPGERPHAVIKEYLGWGEC